jgi:hypothetical protein
MGIPSMVFARRLAAFARRAKHLCAAQHRRVDFAQHTSHRPGTMSAVPAALAKAFGQLSDPAVLRVLGKSIGITLALFAGLGAGVYFGLAAVIESYGYDGEWAGVVAAVLVPVAAMGWPLDCRPPDTLTGLSPSRHGAPDSKKSTAPPSGHSIRLS